MTLSLIPPEKRSTIQVMKKMIFCMAKGEEKMLFVFLLLFFVVLNGRITWEIMLVGVILCALTDVLACRVLGWNREKSKKLLRLIPAGVGYMLLVFREIIKANFAVIKIILSPNLQGMEPALFTFDSHLKSDFARTVLADSITVTPGTYTVKTEGEKLTVHRLGDAFNFEDSDLCFNVRLCGIEKKESERR